MLRVAIAFSSLFTAKFQPVIIRHSTASKLTTTTFRTMSTAASTEAAPVHLLETPDDVLDYWFAASRNAELSVMQQRMQYWFSSKFPEFNQVQTDNAILVHGVLDGTLSSGVWNSDENPNALMAKVILLDQFSRAVFRGSAQAFTGDLVAANLVQQAAKKGWYISHFSPIERFFMCLNLHHTEELSLHEFAQESLIPTMGEGATEDIQGFFRGVNSSFLVEHYEVVKKFGRYPHRNILLGRETTPEEAEWLASPSLPSWAKSQLPAADSGSSK